MNRRRFLGALSAATISSPVLLADSAKKMPTRVLGRTGLRVSILGFGGGSRFLMYKDEGPALEALHRGIDLGIRYLDTAHSYGDGKSEERVGKVMATRRKEVVLATKISARTAENARRQIELSLKRLQTDHLDVMHIHALKGPEDLVAIEAKGGVLEALYEARRQGITRAIGITCHGDPHTLQTALERHDFDCTQMALNAGLASMTDSMKILPAAPDSFERLALPVAVRKRMGIIAMKVFGQEHLVGSAPPEKLLAYALSLPVSLASVGMPNPGFIERNASLARSFSPLSRRERNRLVESIDVTRQHAMLRFFRNHVDA
ncbi:MAG: aldo/keto reductase [Verrucomicrobiales bacterium]|nr:aldo/keto reductase [Verrucomicrobiales bacterium]